MQRKKILLIYPRTGFDPIKPRMPSSLIYLSTSLQKAGYKPIIVDTRVEHNYKEKIRANIKDTIAVCITTMTGMQILFALKFAKFARSLNPSTPIVWGGVHPSILSQQTIQNKYVDIIVKGEGDKVIVELIKSIEKNKPLDKIKGIVFKKDRKIINTPGAEFLDVNELPMPNWDFINVKKYRIFDVQSARGCPHRCEFCYNLVFNKRIWRKKKTKKVINEIEYILKTYKVNEINFIDDNFFTDIKRAEEIIKEIIKRKLKFTWRTNCRADYFDRFDVNFLKLTHKAGLREIQIGCESGSQKILNYIKKDITVKQIINAVSLCKQAGVQAQCSFMMGLPIETKQDNLKTFNLIDKLRKLDPKVLINMIAIYTPYPGSPLFETSKKYGFKPPKTLKEWGNFSYTFVNVPWITGMKKMEYESISYISRFLFYKDELRKKFITPIILIPFWILSFDAALRWKLRFFKFPFEWMLVKLFLVIKRAKQLKKINNL